MTHIAGYNRSQILLLPESLDGYVGTANPVRLIDAFVDGTELAAAGFVRVTPKATGRPGYDPKDPLKLYIFTATWTACVPAAGWKPRLTAISKSSGCFAIWSPTSRPSQTSVASITKAFRPVFRKFVLLSRRMDLFGRELLAVDGTRIKAVNNKDRNFTRASLTKFIELADAKLRLPVKARSDSKADTPQRFCIPR
jgi:transposase